MINTLHSWCSRSDEQAWSCPLLVAFPVLSVRLTTQCDLQHLRQAGIVLFSGVWDWNAGVYYVVGLGEAVRRCSFLMVCSAICHFCTVRATPQDGCDTWTWQIDRLVNVNNDDYGSRHGMV